MLGCVIRYCTVQDALSQMMEMYCTHSTVFCTPSIAVHGRKQPQTDKLPKYSEYCILYNTTGSIFDRVHLLAKLLPVVVRSSIYLYISRINEPNTIGLNCMKYSNLSQVER